MSTILHNFFLFSGTPVERRAGWLSADIAVSVSVYMFIGVGALLNNISEHLRENNKILLYIH